MGSGLGSRVGVGEVQPKECPRWQKVASFHSWPWMIWVMYKSRTVTTMVACIFSRAFASWRFYCSIMCLSLHLSSDFLLYERFDIKAKWAYVFESQKPRDSSCRCVWWSSFLYYRHCMAILVLVVVVQGYCRNGWCCCGLAIYCTSKACFSTPHSIPYVFPCLRFAFLL